KGLLLFLGVALVLSGCVARGASPNLEGGAKDILVVANNSDCISLDPAVAYEFTSTQVDMDIYETLIRYEHDDYAHPLPGLAEKWDVSKDGRTYTFHLRPNMHFASAAPLDAEAVRWSLERTLKLNLGPAEIIADNLAPDRIQAVDAHTVRMTLPHPS